jgi:hypothetical protein
MFGQGFNADPRSDPWLGEGYGVHVRVSLTIRRTPEAVFELLARFEDIPNFVSQVDSAENTSCGSAGVGTFVQAVIYSADRLRLQRASLSMTHRIASDFTPPGPPYAPTTGSSLCPKARS